MNLIIRILITALVALGLSKVLTGIHFEGLQSAIIFAIVLAILNALVKPILVILTIPITILTLGLFLLVINALIIIFADYLMDSMNVDGFWWALIFSLVLSLATSLVNSLLDKK